MFPTRCFTCAKIIGHVYKIYNDDLKKGIEPYEILETHNITRFCCRRMFISHSDISLQKTIYSTPLHQYSKK